MGVVNKWRRLTSLTTMIEVTADGFGENSPKSIKSAIIYRCPLFDQTEKQMKLCSHNTWTYTLTFTYIEMSLRLVFLLYCGRRKLNLTCGFLPFLFMVADREIIFICSAVAHITSTSLLQFYFAIFRRVLKKRRKDNWVRNSALLKSLLNRRFTFLNMP